MDQRRQIQDFLTSRRARVTPSEAGLMAPQRGRRVPGLRREEVATLAGVSVDYYNRLERGNLAAASDGVLDAIARALRLTGVEREHLFVLARAAAPAARRTRRRPPTAPAAAPEARAVLDALVDAPAMLRDARLDVVAMNALGHALYGTTPDQLPLNLARLTFLDPRGRSLWVDWAEIAEDTVGSLQAAAGQDPFDRGLSDLVGELATRSEEFRELWARHDVYTLTRGLKRFRHAEVGRLDLSYQVMHLAAGEGLSLVAFTAAVGTPSHDALTLLSSLLATRADRSPHPGGPVRG